MNAGLGARDKKRSWLPANAKELITYSNNKKYEVIWKLGGEINAFITNGLRWRISGKQYAKDIETIKNILPKNNKLIAASSAFWPIIGEPFPIVKSILKNKTTDFNILGFHYYPQQSTRSPIRLTPARPCTLLNPKRLDRFEKIVKKIEGLRSKYLPKAELWCTETGNAQCGGQPGISDSFVGDLWWLDQLGLAAQNNIKIMVRQTLAGADYGLIDDETLTPNPDYWNSLLWKKLMGQHVYLPQKPKNKFLRVYTHDTPNERGSRTTVLINLSRKNAEKVVLPAFAKVYVMTSKKLQARELYCNGKLIKTMDDVSPMTTKEFLLPLTSYAFIVVSNKGKKDYSNKN